MKKQNDPASRQRILKTAEEIFASKGFDGARVYEIAAKAQVNIALIYYYFKSKQAILNELIDEFIRKSTLNLLEFVKKGGLDIPSSAHNDELRSDFLSFYEKHKNILKIMLMESIKQGEETPPLFKLIDVDEHIIRSLLPGDIEFIDSLLKNIKKKNKDMDQYYVFEFFTGLIPTICYTIFKENWCKNFNLTAGKLREYFMSATGQSHLKLDKK